MRKLFETILREIRFILKTPVLILIVVAAPLTYPFLYSYLYCNKFEKNVPVSVGMPLTRIQ